MAKIRSFMDENLKNKVVLLRTDFNVPTKGNKITDFTRINESIPTIKALIEKQATIIILTHRGRPNGKIDMKLSMVPVAKEVENIIQKPIEFIDNIGEKIDNNPEKIFMLENIRFDGREEKNEMSFAEELSKMADIFINDAFSVSHRSHASLCGIPRFLPSYFGLCMSKEIKALQNSLNKPKEPFIGIIGGSKISTKISVLKNLINKVNIMVIGGAMANTFLRAKDINVGSSLYESDSLDIAKDIMKNAKEKNVKLILPVDGKVSKSFSKSELSKNKNLDEIEPDDMILDLGIESIKIILSELEIAKTVIWNGPLGAIEYPPFDQSTITVAKELARNCRIKNIKAVAGGGDTVYGINLANCIEDFTHVSTAGGAFLEWLEGKTLPGVSAILNKQ